jgi:hypothetical protein
MDRGTWDRWALGAFVGATSIAGLRTDWFPDWLAWLGLLGTIVLLVGGTTWADDGFWAPDGAYQGVRHRDRLPRMGAREEPRPHAEAIDRPVGGTCPRRGLSRHVRTTLTPERKHAKRPSC